jgi:diaminopropionate ammonia-lyase
MMEYGTSKPAFVTEPSASVSESLANHFINPSARLWNCPSEVDTRIVDFHAKLPHYQSTRLIDLPSIATELSVGRILLKEESSRLGLPSFKILGASWATYRAIIEKFSLAESASLEDVGFAAKSQSVSLFAATDGNHGRAVAWMAKTLGIKSKIFVPDFVDQESRKLISKEGAEVCVVAGSYDQTIEEAKIAAEVLHGLLIQDTGFSGYEQIPKAYLCKPSLTVSGLCRAILRY